jgi:putative NADPH-quinone reductase
MRALVTWAQPHPDSFSHAVKDTAVAALRRAGHTVEVIDLHADGFQPVMDADEWRAYRAEEPAFDECTRRYAHSIRQADMLVFVYPSWWFGLPAMLKGFLERVLVPGVAFSVDPMLHRVRGELGHIRHLVGITTHDASRRRVTLLGDAGRRTILRALRLMCGRSCRSTWLAMYGVGASTVTQRRAFLAHVDGALGGPRPRWTTPRLTRRSLRRVGR